MSSDLNDKHRRKKYRVFSSFSFAYSGIKTAIREETNLKIHLMIAVLVICMGIWLAISRMEWVMICMVIGGMVSFELLNTAIERVVDLVTEEFHPLAKQAKDIAAGAAFTFACFSFLIGVIIFLPKIIYLFL